VLALALVLSGCGSKERALLRLLLRAQLPASELRRPGPGQQILVSAVNPSAVAEEMHNRMESEQKQKMDHDSMRMGPGMHHPTPASPDPQQQSQNGSMQGGGMKDM
jgi:hypothetical protein